MANERLTPEFKEAIKKTEVFLKQAFCIDGQCIFIEMVKVENTLIANLTNMMFSLSDSKRGVFYVTLSKS